MALRFASNGGIMVESAEELHKVELPGETLFLDLETTSFDPKKKSVNPWHDCWVLGVCVKTELTPAYYIPVNHATTLFNIDQQFVQLWLITRAFKNKARWVNHNVKYDAHVLYNALGIDVECPLYDTLDLAKLLDSDRYQYGLDALSYDWLKHDISRYENAFKPYLCDKRGSKVIQDYGAIPPDIMAEYGCQDVLSNEKLWYYILDRMPPESMPLVEISSQLTEVFIDMERTGMPINPRNCRMQQAKTLTELIHIQSRLKSLVGYDFQPHVNGDCFDVLCNHYGLPIIEYTKQKKSADDDPADNEDDTGGNPSFAASVLERYKALPGAPKEVLDLMLRHRRLKTFMSYFLEPWDTLHIEGRLHPSYNGTVRTGRMSCSKPNMQQLMDEAKTLVEPDNEDEIIVSYDYSQIEFRMIVHYAKDDACIQSYVKEPLTDFHNWVRDMCHTDRKVAKTVNFLMGYGGGKKKLIGQLIQVEALVDEIVAELEQTQAYIDADEETRRSMWLVSATSRAIDIYNTYHNTLPGIKTTSRGAMNKVYDQGYVTNWFGRRRRLPPKVAHKAFNNLCQGSAADLMKERVCSLFYWLRDNEPRIKLIGVIHDEVLLLGPRAAFTDEVRDTISFILEDSSRPFRVPIRTSTGESAEHWYGAVHNDAPRTFDRATFQPKNYQQTYDRGVKCPFIERGKHAGT